MSNSPKRCVSCSRCLSFCPVFLASQREELSPKAKNQLFEHLETGEPVLDEKLCRKLEEMCIACGRCASACAQHLSVPDRLSQVRARHPGWEQRLWNLWITGGDALWPVLGTLGRALGRAPSKGVIGSVKAMADRPREAPWIRVTRYDASRTGQRAMFFAGCTARRVRPEWADKGRAILEGLGFTVVSAKESCCGGTLLSAGLHTQAFEAMRGNVEAWRNAGRPAMVTACDSCLYALGRYPEQTGLFLNTDEAGQWSKGLTGLAALWGDTEFDVRPPDAPLRWHAPCHGLAHQEDRHWLERLLGPSLRTPEGVNCCGLGGVVQLTNRPLTARIADACWDALGRTPGTRVLTGCSGCTIQLSATRPRDVSVAHWLDAVSPSAGPDEAASDR